MREEFLEKPTGQERLARSRTYFTQAATRTDRLQLHHLPRNLTGADELPT